MKRFERWAAVLKPHSRAIAATVASVARRRWHTSFRRHSDMKSAMVRFSTCRNRNSAMRREQPRCRTTSATLMPRAAFARMNAAVRRARAEDELMGFVDSLATTPFGWMQTCRGAGTDFLALMRRSSSAAVR